VPNRPNDDVDELTRPAEHFRQPGEAQRYGYNISESMSSNIDDKTMHELYMWPFVDAIRAGVGSIMCSYNQVNNSYACQNSKLMNGLLKDELGFQGFIMSDWQAQHTGAASAVAGLDMTMPGDTEFNSGRSFWGANLTIAVLNGTVPAWRVDDMALRIMAAFFKAGMELEQPEVNFSSWTSDTIGPVHFAARDGIQVINKHVDVRGNHAALIREIAAKGTVLLKNNGILPLNKPKFLTVIGEDAGQNPKGPNGCGDRGCDDGTLGMGWGSGTANFPYLVTPDSALQAQAVSDNTRYESILSNYQWPSVRPLISQANVTAVVFVNADSGEGYISVGGNEGDRQNLTLWKNGDDLIRNVSAICPNTIVVIHSPGPVLVAEWSRNANVSAILWAGIPGQESGNSITDVLYGRVNPAGRSPFTWGPSRESYGTDVLYKPNNGNGAPQDDFTEGVFIDYRHFDKAAPAATDAGAPTYEFGFGLSYTTFEYSDLVVEKREVRTYGPTTGSTAAAPTFGTFSRNYSDYLFPADRIRYTYPYLNVSDPRAASADPRYGQTPDQFLPPRALDGTPQPRLPSSGEPGGNRQLWDVLYSVRATVTNKGKLAGDEVPQLYVSLGGPNDPPKVLRGFDRFRVEPGQGVTFKADITRRDLSNWDTATQNWVISAFPKTVFVGSSSRKLPLKATLQ
jgi:beta-glucosidase